MLSNSNSVRIVEVGPRDGLQNISQVVPTALKIELIKKLAACGNTTIEATSFVSPKWIPQLADAKDVLEGIKPLSLRTNIKFPVLVPTIKGLDLAAHSNAREIAVFIAASEGFSQKNINCSIAEALLRTRLVVEKAIKLNLKVRGYISCIFSCPVDGPTDPHRVLQLTKELLQIGCYEISLGDTVGDGTIADVKRLFSILLQSIHPGHLAGHFHDTYGQAVSNVLQAYSMGIRTFDSSVAGLGGCPYAVGARGNLASEDIVYTFHKLGVQTGIDLDRLVEVGTWISDKLGIPNGSRAGAAISASRKSVAHASSDMGISKKRTWRRVESTDTFAVFRSNTDVKIILTRPKQGNTLTMGMMHDLTHLFEKLSHDLSVFHIIITGKGKYFCTGMDVSKNGTVTDGDLAGKETQFLALNELFEVIERSPQVTIAMINGSCYGGGIGLAFSCDIRLAACQSTFTLSEVRLGLAPAVISRMVIREWGQAVAREAMLTARPVSAQELKRQGAIHGVGSNLQQLETLLETYLDILSKSAPRASKLCKDLVNAVGDKQQYAIKKVFDEMMGPSQEAKYGVEQFRLGIKPVNWQPSVSSDKPKL